MGSLGPRVRQNSLENSYVKHHRTTSKNRPSQCQEADTLYWQN